MTLAVLAAAGALSATGPATADASTGEPRALASLVAPARVCPDENRIDKRNRAIRAMTCMTNYARAADGLTRLRKSRGLNRSASAKAADILRCGAFSHTACGRPFSFWIEKKYVKRQCWLASENLAWGSRRAGGVRSIFKAWMKSPGHRSAILSKRYSDVGIGFRVGKFEGRPSARIWVTHFGRLC